MRKKLLLVCLCGLSSIVSAAEWYVAASTKDMWALVDKASVKMNGSKRTVWEWIIFPQRTKDNYDNLSVQNTYDCAQQTSQIQHFVSYTGSKLQFESGAKGAVKPIIPDTGTASIYDLVCSGSYENSLLWTLDLATTQKLMRQTRNAKP